MASIALADIIRAAVRHKFDGVDDQVNVMHFVMLDAPAAETDQQILTDIAETIGDFYATFASHMSNLIEPVGIDFYNVTDDGPLGQYPFPGTYGGGTGSGEALPPHDTVLMLFPTAFKRRVGRIYLPTMTEAVQNRGQLTSGLITSLDAAASLFLSAQAGTITSLAYEYRVYSRSNGTADAPTGWRPSSRVAVQRRRKEGRGS